MPCNISREEAMFQIQHSSVMRDTAHMWASSHHISDWKQSEWLPLSPTNDAIILKYNIPFSTSLVHAEYDYISYIHFPSILKSVMNVDVKLSVRKHVYLDADTIYTVTGIHQIPVVEHCFIFARMRIMDRGVVLVRSVVTYEEFPWYAKIFQSVIEGKVQESLVRYSDLLTANLCRVQKDL
jgi:hypothetical protein